MEPATHTVPVGQPRNIGICILLFVITLGFYGWYWAYKTEEEIKEHSSEGLGGVLGLVVWILASFISAFVIPSEIGKMHAKEGQAPPVNGWTGLWLIPFGGPGGPGVGWVVQGQGGANRDRESHGATCN